MQAIDHSATLRADGLPLPKGLPTITGNVAHAPMKDVGKKVMKGMHQSSVTRVGGQTKYSVKDTHIDDMEGPGEVYHLSWESWEIIKCSNLINTKHWIRKMELRERKD